jgi:hypothetical protein
MEIMEIFHLLNEILPAKMMTVVEAHYKKYGDEEGTLGVCKLQLRKLKGDATLLQRYVSRLQRELNLHKQHEAFPQYTDQQFRTLAMRKEWMGDVLMRIKAVLSRSEEISCEMRDRGDLNLSDSKQSIAELGIRYGIQAILMELTGNKIYEG